MKEIKLQSFGNKWAVNLTVKLCELGQQFGAKKAVIVRNFFHKEVPVSVNNKIAKFSLANA